MSQINLLQLSIISLSAIHTSTSSSPRRRGGSITFMGTALVLIRKLIKINITFGVNSLGSRIIHTTIYNHLINALQLLIFLVQNRSRTKNLIGKLLALLKRVRTNTTLRILILRNRIHIKKNRLARRRISSILRCSSRINNRGFIMISEKSRRLSTISKRKKTTIRSHIIRGSRRLKILGCTVGRGFNLNGKSRKPTLYINGHTIFGNGLVTIDLNPLGTITSKTDTSKPQRKCDLHRIRQRITINACGRTVSNIGKTTPYIQRRIPCKLLTHSLINSIINVTASCSISGIEQKVCRNILYTLLHGRRINRHIIIPRHTKITNVVHLSRRIRRNLLIRRNRPIASGIKTTITVPIKHHNGSPASSGPHSIRRKSNASTLKGNLIKNHSKLLVLRRSTKQRQQTNLSGTISTEVTSFAKTKADRSLHLNNKVGTVTLLSSRTHIATRGSRRIRTPIASHIEVAIPQ